VNVVFLSPNFPPQYPLFCAALRAQGAKVLGIGDSPHQALAPLLSQSLDEYYYVPDMNRAEEMGRALGYFTWRHGRIDRIDSLNEYWLDTEARLREDFNIPGPRPAEVSRWRSKSGMREIFRSAGVPCTEGERFVSPEQVRAFARRVGFPLVFKPDVGVGAAWTFQVSDERELDETLSRELPVPNYVVERFCRGSLCTYDGLTDKDGNIVFAVSLAYSSGVMQLVNRASDLHYYTRRVIPPRLEELGKKTVAAFGLRERFFHIEFFEEPDGDYRALEVNVRPPGGFTTDMVNYTCDFDMYQLWARALRGESLAHFAYERKYACAHIARRHGRAYKHSDEELRRRLGEALLEIREVPPVLSGVMGNVMYLARFREEAEVAEAARLIQAPP